MTVPVRHATLGAWLEWQESLHPRAIELGLDRVRRVLARTGWRAPRGFVITVGGTNGKGSTVALVDSMLRAAGLRVGTFTSPHLVDYTERVRVDGMQASEASLVVAFERIADALGPDSLTFFEFNTLAALLVFETASPDAMVLEVGMGGRLDAVNVVDPDVAIVTSVALDHMEWLGPDVESIGREKAGIFRAARPAICGMATPPQSVEAVAAEVGAELRVRGRDFDAHVHADGRWDFQDARGRLEGLPAPALEGPVQYGNAACAVAAIRESRGRLAVDRTAIEQGLRTVRVAGRFERRQDAAGVEWILDVAHNPEAAASLADNLRRRPAAGRTIAVCGMLGDKDVESVVAALVPVVDHWIAAGTEGPRALTDVDLEDRARRVGVGMAPGGRVHDAVDLARRLAVAGDRVVVFGSFHTVGPASLRV
jgi:dihydrofolate synthase/folylpolyglutamate synthase